MQETELKKAYNKVLTRFYNGCNYIEEHPEQTDKYYLKVLELKNTIDKILEKLPNATEEEILNGFKV